jgi:hypothetical protein
MVGLTRRRPCVLELGCYRAVTTTQRLREGRTVLRGRGVKIFSWFFIVAIDLLCIYFCFTIAERKGYSGLLFAILGLFFFIITVIVLLILPDKRKTA